MTGQLVDEALEPAGLPELAGAGIGGIDRKLGREQHGVGAGIGDLLRHQLPVAHVAFQRRAVAVEEHDDDARFADIETLRDMHQDAIVVVGRVLPVDPAAIAAVAAAPVLGDVEERRIGARIVAEIGECRGFQADQRGLVLARRALVRRRRLQGRHPIGRGLRLRRSFGGRVGGMKLAKTLVRGREAIPELRSREALVEAVACRCLRIGRELTGARRLAALRERE